MRGKPPVGGNHRSVTAVSWTRAALVPFILLTLCAGARGQLTPDFSATPTSGQVPLLVNFSDTSTGTAPVFWIWDFGDGGASNAQNPVHTYLAPGSYTVSMTVIASLGAFGTETKTDFIVVTPAPLVADFTATPSSGALPLLVNFSDTSSGVVPTAWTWDFGDGAASTVQNPTHSYLAVGSYTVKLTAFFHQQTATVVKQGIITVNPAPLLPDFSASPVAGVNPLTVSFVDTSTGAIPTAWSWDFGDDTGSSAQNPTHTYTAPGLYDVALTAFVIQQSETILKQGLINVAPAPLVPDFAASPVSGTNPLTVSFTDQSSGSTPTAWLWEFGDGARSTQQNPSHTYVGPGAHTVALTAFVGTQGERIEKQNFIQVNPAPLVVDFSAAPSLGHAPLWVSFSDQSSGATITAWTWDFGDGGSANAQDPDHQYLAAGTYTVQLTAFVGLQAGVLVKAGAVTVVDPLYPLVVELSASDAGVGDRFGYAVSISADQLLCGAIYHDTFVTNSGAAYLYVRTPSGTWQEAAKLLASDRKAGDLFGTSVAISDGRALIGAPLHEHSGPPAGAAYLFERAPNADWREVAELKGSHAGWQARFGSAVALEDDLAVVGASGSGSTTKQGAAYVFQRDEQGVWNTVAILSSEEEAPGNLFGSSVALSSGRVLVGAPSDDQAGYNTGSAYVFEESSTGEWLLLARLHMSNPELNSQFGAAVSLSGHHALIGAPGQRNFTGTAYVFERMPDGSWELSAELIAGDGTTLNRFGSAVSIFRNEALVGAQGKGSFSVGAAYVFRRQPEGTWSEVSELLAFDGSSGDLFGASVSLTDERLVVGAYKHDQPPNLNDSGTAYVHELDLDADLSLAASPARLTIEARGSDPNRAGVGTVLLLQGAPPGALVQLSMAPVGESATASEERHEVVPRLVMVRTARVDAAGRLVLPLRPAGGALPPCRLQAFTLVDGVLECSNVLVLPSGS